MYQLKANQQQTIVALRGQGRSKRRIARELDVDRATVRKYLAQADSKSPTPQTGSDALPPQNHPPTRKPAPPPVSAPPVCGSPGGKRLSRSEERRVGKECRSRW